MRIRYNLFTGKRKIIEASLSERLLFYIYLYIPFSIEIGQILWGEKE